MASEITWKEAVLRQIAEARKPEKGYLQSYLEFVNPNPKPFFVDSYMVSVKQNAERRSRERSKQNKGFEQFLMLLFAVCFVVGFIVIVLTQVVWMALILIGVLIAVIYILARCCAI